MAADGEHIIVSQRHRITCRCAIDLYAVCAAEIVHHKLPMLITNLGMMPRDAAIVHDDFVRQVTADVGDRSLKAHRLTAAGTIQREPRRWNRDILSPCCLLI